MSMEPECRKEQQHGLGLLQGALIAGLLCCAGIHEARAETPTSELCEIDIMTLQERYASGVSTVAGAMDWYLRRMERLDRAGPRYGAMTYVDAKAALEAARKLDHLGREARSKLPLFGVPVVVKDMIDVAGMPTSASSLVLASAPARRDAEAVERLRQAGAIILGKANMTGISNPYVTGFSALAMTINPYDADRSPQGSSHGSAVAVSTNMAVIALGEETTDSLRSVADAAAIVTLRPTRGSVSTEGMFPLSPNLDVIGPMARTVSDVAAVFDVLKTCAGPCSQVRQLPDLRGIRLGVPIAYASTNEKDGRAIDGEIGKLFQQALEDLRAAGAEIVDVSEPSLSPTDGRYPSSHPKYRAVGYPDWDSAAFDAEDDYAHKQAIDSYLRNFGSGEFDNIAAVVERSRASASVDDLLWALEYADEAAAEPTDNPHLLHQMAAANDRLHQKDIVQAANRFSVDAYVFPTSYSFPLSIVDMIRDKEEEGENVLAYAPVDFGLPALVVPIGFSEAGLPASLTLMGLRGRDERLLEIGMVYERMTRHRRPAQPSCR
jgi:amidase